MATVPTTDPTISSKNGTDNAASGMDGQSVTKRYVAPFSLRPLRPTHGRCRALQRAVGAAGRCNCTDSTHTHASTH